MTQGCRQPRNAQRGACAASAERWPRAAGGNWIEPTDLAYFDLWLRQRSSHGCWLNPQLELIERPANISKLPRVRWPNLPPGAIAQATVARDRPTLLPSAKLADDAAG